MSTSSDGRREIRFRDDQVFQNAVNLAQHIYGSDPSKFVSLLEAHRNFHFLHLDGLLTSRPDFAFPYALVLGNNTVDGLVQVYVVFQGTKSWGHIVTDSMAIQSINLRGAQGKIHKGFLDAASQVPLEPLLQLLKLGLLERGTRYQVELVFCGHSLGAALAQTVCALLFSETRFEAAFSARVSIIGIGSPLVGDRLFAEGISSAKMKRHIQVIHDLDIVPPLFRFLSNMLSGEDSTSNSAEAADKLNRQNADSMWTKLATLLKTSFDPNEMKKLMGESSASSLAGLIGRFSALWAAPTAVTLLQALNYLKDWLFKHAQATAANYYPAGDYYLISSNTSEHYSLTPMDGQDLEAHISQLTSKPNFFESIQYHCCHVYYNALCRTHKLQSVNVTINLASVIRPSVEKVHRQEGNARFCGKNEKIVTCKLKGDNLGFVKSVSLKRKPAVLPSLETYLLQNIVPSEILFDSLTIEIRLLKAVSNLDDYFLELNTEVHFKSPHAPGALVVPHPNVALFIDFPMTPDPTPPKRSEAAEMPLMKLLAMTHSLSTLLQPNTSSNPSSKTRLEILLDELNRYGIERLKENADSRVEMQKIAYFLANALKGTPDLLGGDAKTFYSRILASIMDLSPDSQGKEASEVVERAFQDLGNNMPATPTASSMSAEARCEKSDIIYEVRPEEIKTFQQCREQYRIARHTRSAILAERISNPTFQQKSELLDLSDQETLSTAVDQAAESSLCTLLSIAGPRYRLFNINRLFNPFWLTAVFGLATLIFAASGVGIVILTSISAMTLPFIATVTGGAATLILAGTMYYKYKLSEQLERDYRKNLLDTLSFLQYPHEPSANLTSSRMEEDIYNIFHLLWSSRYGGRPVSDVFRDEFLLSCVRYVPHSHLNTLCMKLNLTLKGHQEHLDTAQRNSHDPVLNGLYFLQFIHKVLCIHEIRCTYASLGIIGVMGSTKAGKSSLVNCLGFRAQPSMTVNTLDLIPFQLKPNSNFAFVDFPGCDDPRQELQHLSYRFGALVDIALVVCDAKAPSDLVNKLVLTLTTHGRDCTVLLCFNQVDKLYTALEISPEHTNTGFIPGVTGIIDELDNNAATKSAFVANPNLLTADLISETLQQLLCDKLKFSQNWLQELKSQDQFFAYFTNFDPTPERSHHPLLERLGQCGVQFSYDVVNWIIDQLAARRLLSDKETEVTRTHFKNRFSKKQ